jgi:hypothetical protein
MDAPDARLDAPATHRNIHVLRAELARVLPATGTVLEVASGTGQHVCALAEAFPHLRWQPSDADADARASIDAWTAHHARDNVAPPLALDARAQAWPLARADAILCVNMAHIAPWAATLGLLDGAARVLPSDGPLVLYGPWHVGGHPTAPSNAAFDDSLRARDPAWGVRPLEDLLVAAVHRGFCLARVEAVPANNLVIVLRRAADLPR